MIEDKLLIWRLKRGSSDALRHIYNKHKDSLLRLAFGLLNDRSAAEDIVHDFFVSFAQSTEKLKLNGSLKSYLATCVVNRARNANKARQRQKSIDLDGHQPVTTSSRRPEQWIIESEQLKQLNEALAELPNQQREVVILHLQGQMKFRAIAKLQNVSINTVQSRYRYGLEKLRSTLNSEI